jgi:YidC/Oxa1 family membrane protein insertase
VGSFVPCKKQSRDQIVLQHIAPKAKAIQEKYKEQKDVLAKETMALYAKYKINPFTSIFLLLIQLPFLIGLYQIFYYGIDTYKQNLYSANVFPEFINNHFFIFNLSEKSILLAILAGATQLALGFYMFNNKSTAQAGSENDFAQAMNMQMKYFMPVVIGVVCYLTPSVISLYIIVTNLFGIGQEIVIKKPLEKEVNNSLLSE